MPDLGCYCCTSNALIENIQMPKLCEKRVTPVKVSAATGTERTMNGFDVFCCKSKPHYNDKADDGDEVLTESTGETCFIAAAERYL